MATPLDVSKWQAAPCTVLTQAQVNSLAMNATSRDNSASGVGPGCYWSDKTDLTKPALGIGFVTANKSGLGSLYSKHAQGQMPILNRLSDIAGYPAVVYGDDPNLVTNGACSVAVGVTDQLVISADVNISDGPSKSNPCPTAISLATSAIDTMTGKS